MRITLLEPAMCCSTGLCGEVVDDVLVATAANLKWLRSLGHEVSRHNISNDGEAFKEFPQAVEKLQREGLIGLPFVLIDGRLVMSGAYPHKTQWEQWMSADKVNPRPMEPSATSSCCSGTTCC